MRKLLLFVPLLAVFGCSNNASSPTATTDQPAQGAGKEGEKTQGISADQVGVTNAGSNADKVTGSKAGGQ